MDYPLEHKSFRVTVHFATEQWKEQLWLHKSVVFPLCKNMKIKRQRSINLPLLLCVCVCKTWSVTLTEGHKPKVFGNWVLRKIFESKRDEVTGNWRQLHSEELHDLQCSPNITWVIKSRKEWDGWGMRHVWEEDECIRGGEIWGKGKTWKAMASVRGYY